MLTVWAALGESGSLQSVLSCSPEWSCREGGGGGQVIRLGGEWGQGSGKGLWGRDRRCAEFKFKAAGRDCEARVSWGGATTQTEHREF